MLKMILVGCCGQMGRVISQRVAEEGRMEIVAGVDKRAGAVGGYPVYSRMEECTQAADVVLDFSHPSSLPATLRYGLEHHCPLVIATTGLGEQEIASIHEAARQIPVFFTFNMSLGINLMTELCRQAAAVLGEGFDVEIIERHHNQKIDAPSGTAIMLAETLAQALPHPSEFVFDRHSVRRKRGEQEIGIHSVRGGNMVGEHEVLFAGTDETFSLIHRAQSKGVFATGALRAAQFLQGKPAGLYSMKELLAGAQEPM